MRLPYVQLIQTCWQYSGTRRREMVLIYLLLGGASASAVLEPYILSQLINTLQKGSPNLLADAAYWLSIYVVLTVLFWVLHGPARLVERKLAFHIKQQFVERMFRAVTSLPMRWHHDHHSGDTINRVNKAADALYRFADSQFYYLQSIVKFVGALGALMVLAPWIGVASVLCTGLVLWLMVHYDRKLIPLAHTENEADHKLNAGLFDYISNIGSVITLRLEEQTRREITRRLERIYVPLRESIHLNEWKWFALSLVIVLLECGSVLGYIGVHLMAGEALMLGTLVAVYQYTNRLSDAFAAFAMSWQDLVQRQTDLHAVDTLLADARDLVAQTPVALPTGWSEVALTGLTFAYANGDPKLTDAHLTLRRGRRLALVGESGSGKSTLLALLRGLHEPISATVVADGAPVPGGLRAVAAVATLVPQDPEIFEQSLRENITAGLPHTDDALRHVARVAAFDAVAESLPRAYETDIREKGVNLSGGQKQRLALARGVFAAKESDLLLLDEPTSSVDPLTELTVYRRLFAEFPNACVVSSIHRLNLLDLFDEVVVMEKGRVVEHGPVADVVARKGLLWHMLEKSQKKSAHAG
jgi:ATP-binding cassette subfamily B protein